MRLADRTLDLPHPRGARALVRALLRDAEDALAGLEAGTEAEALHDFRVAVRRLRSAVRALRPSLRGAVRRRHERRLRKIARATSPARDAEVQHAWLAGERPRLPPRAAPAARWLARRLADRRRAGRAEAASALAPRFRELALELAARLRRPVEPSRRGPRLAEVLAELVQDQEVELERVLAAVRGPLDVGGAHAARIAAKRLRYSLEPLRGSARADAEAAVARLKELQDVLGELHDAHVLEELLAASVGEIASAAARRVRDAVVAGEPARAAARDAPRDPLTPGLLVLEARVSARVVAAHAALARDWSAARRAPLRREVAAIARALARPPRRPPVY
jgi:CHAD domain-containing protein